MRSRAVDPPFPSDQAAAPRHGITRQEAPLKPLPNRPYRPSGERAS